ncbi:MAG: FMN-binding negative transcriptional regulator [Rhodobacteraceae bacterium]|nr:FMN-binding negative transcriptional regulator [Paracoccaceae bacterium]
MHPNPAFRQTPAEANLAFARSRGFATLAVNAAAGPLLSHIPFLLADDGASVELHLVRSNPIVPLIATPQPAVLSVTGPEGYISPDWYGLPDQVPTWNYVAVHLRGRLELSPEAALRPLLDRLSDHFEALLLPKTPWTSAKMSPGSMERMMRMIVPCRLIVEDVQGTWKFGQNKPEAARLGAADGLEAAALSPEAATLATLMRNA